MCDWVTDGWIAKGAAKLKRVTGSLYLMFGGVNKAGGEVDRAIWGEADFSDVAVSVQVVRDSLLPALKPAGAVTKEGRAFKLVRDAAFDIGDFVVEFL